MQLQSAQIFDMISEREKIGWTSSIQKEVTNLSKDKIKDNKNNLQLRNSTVEFLIFSYQNGGDGVEVRVEDGTVWLSQRLIGQLFDTSSDNVGLHLKNIFKDDELQVDSVTEIFSATAEVFLVVQKEGNHVFCM